MKTKNERNTQKRKAKAKKSRIRKAFERAMGAISNAFENLRQPQGRLYIDINELTYQQHKEFLEIRQPHLNEAKGLKEFDINGTKVWALNQKNAERKAPRLN